ncbi:Large membrane protein (Fragment) OS=Streptomyces microflavus OX=1919 GN=G3I39_05245 PE=4 SV=1 [Streptomyces microflavus]
MVGDEDGPGALLKVTKQAPGTWTFARTTPVKPCDPGKMCANQSPPEAGGQPVSEKAAKAAAAPVLKAVGQDDAALNAGQLMGDVRVVNADPKVDGLPTYGWSTGVQIGPDGKVAGGSGQLKALEKGDTYPAIGADEALKQLNEASRAKGDGGKDIGGCATPVPLEGEPKPSVWSACRRTATGPRWSRRSRTRCSVWP